jgi:predicted small metal-binding protein
MTIAECAENARQCEWYASKARSAEERKFLRRMAKHWKKLAAEKERDVLTAARSVA